jgi:uncharacterized membrane protein
MEQHNETDKMKSAIEHKVREVHNWHEKQIASRTFGQRMSDNIANGMGSWGFIITQTIFVIIWMGLNLVAYMHHWDPFPFILLNLVFSTQAAYAAPIIMMSQNRASQRDREQAQSDYETNIAAKEEIEQLMTRLDRIELDKLDKIFITVYSPISDTLLWYAF